MKMPLLAGSSTQNSARIWKSLYAFFDTRKPLPLSAWTTPSASFQLASPIWFHWSRLLPSNRTTQPAWPDDWLDCPRTATPSNSSPRMGTDQRFMLISSHYGDLPGFSLDCLNHSKPRCRPKAAAGMGVWGLGGGGGGGWVLCGAVGVVAGPAGVFAGRPPGLVSPRRRPGASGSPPQGYYAPPSYYAAPGYYVAPAPPVWGW